MNRLIAASTLLFSTSVLADIPVPASIDFELISPTEDYHFFIENQVPMGFIAVDPETNFYPPLKALIDVFAIDRTGSWSIGNPQGYHHGHELLGFVDPDFNGNIRNVNYWNCKPAGCDNGFATAGQILMPAPLYRNASHSCTRMVLGHELFHHVQFAYKAAGAHSFGSWVTEGMARAMQDKIYDDLDTDPDASCIAPYLSSVSSYLKGGSDSPPQQELPIWDNSYRAALWWTYLMEQFGEATDEPVYGADFIRTWYENAVDNGVAGNSFATTDQTIKQFDPDNSFLATFRRFALANVLKDMDLSTKSANFQRAYSYRDEQPNGPINQDRYSKIKLTDSLAISETEQSDSALFAPNAYATQYFDLSLANCPSGWTIEVDFNPAANDPFFGLPLDELGAWGVIFAQSTNGGTLLEDLRPATFYKKLDEDWSVTVIQPTNPYERALISTTGVTGQMLGELTAQCQPPPPNPYAPTFPFLNPLDPMTPGPPQVLTFGEVCAVPSAPLPGLDPSAYSVEIDDMPVPVLAIAPRDDGHCLQVEIPPGGPTQDLTVALAGQSVTVPDAIVRNTPAANVLVAVDTSTTMLFPPNGSKLEDVKSALPEFLQLLLPVDAAPGLPKVGLIDFAGDDFEPNADARVASPLTVIDRSGLAQLNSAIDAFASAADRQTSIGDAIATAQQEFIDNADQDQRKHLLLITDGSENEAVFWSEIKDSVLASGFDIHVIALGATTDQPLAYDIAQSTDGLYRYVSVASTVDQVALTQALAEIAAHINHDVQIAEHVLQPNQTNLEFNFGVPPSTQGLLLPAVQSARSGIAGGPSTVGSLTLTDPEGTAYEIRLDNAYIKSYSVSGSGTELPPGQWIAQFQATPGIVNEVMISVFADRQAPLAFSIDSGQTSTVGGNQTISVGTARDLSAGWFDACGRSNDCASGEPDPPIILGRLPNGQSYSSRLEATETGADSDSVPTESFSLNFEKIQLRNFHPAGSLTGLDDDGTANRLGSYRFNASLPVAYPGYTVTLMASHHYAVDATSITDSDGDRLPDPYEQAHRCLDPTAADSRSDADEDGLSSADEFNRGTHPCRSDTDGGGETDGSEVAAGRDPILEDDDAIRGVAFLAIAHELTHVEQQSPSQAPNSIKLRYGSSSQFTDLVLKRGFVDPLAAPDFDTFIDLESDGDGLYVDPDLTPGTEYCYQLEASDGQGNLARPSAIVCHQAASDPLLPWGDLVINNGAPRTDDPRLELTVGLYNKPTDTSEMRVEVDDVSSGWIAYRENYRVTVATSDQVRTIEAIVTLRDREGQQSVPYVDQVELWPPESLGTLTGQLVLEGVAPGADPGRRGVMIYLDNPAEPPAYTDAEGRFWFEHVIPGPAETNGGHPGWGEVMGFAEGVVEAGQTTDLGSFQLAIGSERLLADGFE